jgi:hypothetical protein
MLNVKHDQNTWADLMFQYNRVYTNTMLSFTNCYKLDIINAHNE